MDLHQHVFRVPDGILLSLGLSWSFVGKCPADLDLAAVSFGKNGRFLDVVFFNHTMAGKSDAEAQLLQQQYDLPVKDLPYMLLSGDSRTGGEAENRVMSWREVTQKSPTCSFPRAFSTIGNVKRGKNGAQKREAPDGSRCHTSKVKDDIVRWEQEECARRAGGGVEPQHMGRRSDDPLLSHTFSRQERELYREFSAADGRLQHLLHTHPDSFARSSFDECGQSSLFRRHPASLSDESILFHIGKIPVETECIFICVTSYTGMDFSQLAEVRLDVFEELPLLPSEEGALKEDGVTSPHPAATAPRHRRRLGMFDLKSSTGNGTANLCACLVRVPNDGGNNDRFPPITPTDNRKGETRPPPDPSLLMARSSSADALLATTLHSFTSPSILLGVEGSQNPLPLSSRLWDLREVNIRAMGYTFADLLPVMLNILGISSPSHLETLRCVPNYSLRKAPPPSFSLLPSAGGGASFFSSFLPVMAPSSVRPTAREKHPHGIDGNTVEHLRRQFADLRFGIGWDGHVDVDAFCIVLDKSNQYLTHFHPKLLRVDGTRAEISPGAPKDERGGEGGMKRWANCPCRHSGDCTTGIGFTGDGESIDLLLHMLPAEAHVLVLGATLVSTTPEGKSCSMATTSTSAVHAKTNAFSAFSSFSHSASSPPPTISGMPIASPCQRASHGGTRRDSRPRHPLMEREAYRSIVEVPGLYMRLQNRPLLSPHTEEIDRWDVFRDASSSSLEGSASHRGDGGSHSGASTPIGASIAAEEEMLAPHRVAYATHIRAHTLLLGALWNFSMEDWNALSSLFHRGGNVSPSATLYDPVAAGALRTAAVGTGADLPASLFPSLSRPFPSARDLEGSSRRTLEEEERHARHRLSKPSPSGTATSPLPSSRPAATPPTTPFPAVGGAAGVEQDTMGAAAPRAAGKEASSIFSYFPLRQVVPVDETLSFSGIISYTESLFMLARRLHKREKKRKEKEMSATPRGMEEEMYQWKGGGGGTIGAGYPMDSPSSYRSGGGTDFRDTEGASSARGGPPLRSSSGMRPQTTNAAVAAASSVVAEKWSTALSARSAASKASFLSPLPSVWSLTEAVAAAGWGGGSMVLSGRCAAHDKGAVGALVNANDAVAQATPVPRLLFSSHSMFPSPFGIVLQFIEVTTLSPHLPGDAYCIGEAWICGAGPERRSVVAAQNRNKWKHQKSEKMFTLRGNVYGGNKQGSALSEAGGWMNAPFQTSFHMEERIIDPSSGEPHRSAVKASRGIREDDGGERSTGGIGVESQWEWNSPSSRPHSAASASVVAARSLPGEGDPCFCSVGRPGPVSHRNGYLHTNAPPHDSGRNTDAHSSLHSSISRNAVKNGRGDRTCFVVYPHDSICILLHSRAALGVGKIHLYPLLNQLSRASHGSTGSGGSSRPVASLPLSMQNSPNAPADGRTRMKIDALHEPSRLLPFDKEMRQEEGIEDEMYDDDDKVEWKGGKLGSSVEVEVSLRTPGDEECAPFTPEVTSPSGMREEDNTDAIHAPSSAAIVPAQTQAVIKVRLTCIRLEECVESLKAQMKWTRKNEAKHRLQQVNQFNEKQRKLFKWFC